MKSITFLYQYQLGLWLLFIGFTSIIFLSNGCKPDPCEKVNCLNGGTCDDGKCLCKEGFGGENCDKRTDKKLISLNIHKAGSASLFPANVKINQEKKEVYVNVGHNIDLTNVEYSVTVSPGAVLATQPSNFLNPANLVIRAEDGSTTTYKMIVTKIEAFVSEIIDSHWSSHRRADNVHLCNGAYWTTEPYSSSPNIGLDIQIGCCGSICHENDFIGIYIRNKNPESIFLIGLKGNVSDGHIRIRWGTENKLRSPAVAGFVNITKYDKTNLLVSGTFKDIKFHEGIFPDDYPYYLLNGEFHNVRIFPE